MTRSPRTTPPRVPDADRIADKILKRLEDKATSNDAEVAASLRRIEGEMGHLREIVEEHGGKLKSLSSEMLFMQISAGDAASRAEKAVAASKDQVSTVAADVGASAAGAVAEVLDGKLVFDPRKAFTWTSLKWSAGAIVTWVGVIKVIIPFFDWILMLAKHGIEGAIGHPMGPD